MKIWFDADNAPHVLVMRPLVMELTRRGHQVVFTARDRASTCELLDLYGLEYLKVGGRFRSGTIGKVTGTLKRALDLALAMRTSGAEVSFGHGSRALPLASWLLGVPSVSMYDYEWVSPSIFNRFCSAILLPEVVVVEERLRETGIRSDRAVPYPGFKESLYLQEVSPDSSIAEELGLESGRVKVLLRPPATTAHYHNREADTILEALLDRLLAIEEVQLIWLSREPEQDTLLRRDGIRAEVVIPGKPYPGPKLILSCDIVIGGGGTMTREAAILGIPAVSFFRGRSGKVDEALESMGRLVLLDNLQDVQRLRIIRRGEANPLDGGNPLETVVGAILSAGGC